MKKMKFTAAALSMLLVLGSCGTSQKTGTAAGAGAGAAQGGNEAGYGDDVVDADYKEV